MDDIAGEENSRSLGSYARDYSSVRRLCEASIMTNIKLAVCYCAPEHHQHLAASIDSAKGAGDIFVFVNRRIDDESDVAWQTVAEIANGAGAEVVLGEWKSEL